MKEEGRTRFSKGWQGCSEGFPEGKAQGKSRGAALPTRGKPRPSRPSNTVFQSTEVSRRVNVFERFFNSVLMRIANSDTTFFPHKFVVQNTFVINYSVVGPL